MEQPVIVFDGVCNLCNASVDFVMRHDPDGTFQFTSNQSEAGQEILELAGLDGSEAETVVLWQDEVARTRSTAVLHIARRLGMPWKLAYGLIVIPAPVRDFFYRLLAKNRFRLFGQRETCRVPTPEERTRFLESPR